MNDSLGDRMKSNYEDRTRIKLPRKSYTIIRIDGKAFHTYTRGLERPFDLGFVEDMDATAIYLCKKISGAKFAFVQSDEISILVTDFDEIGTQAWFDNNLQKMCSVSASMATAEFNKQRLQSFIIDEGLQILSIGDLSSFKSAEFDSRVFQISSKTEVYNYFLWRQQDTTRNAISTIAQSLYSHKELEGKNGDQKQEMIFQKGINFNEYDPKLKRGRLIFKFQDKWQSFGPDIFSQSPEDLRGMIPDLN